MRRTFYKEPTERPLIRRIRDALPYQARRNGRASRPREANRKISSYHYSISSPHDFAESCKQPAEGLLVGLIQCTALNPSIALPNSEFRLPVLIQFSDIAVNSNQRGLT